MKKISIILALTIGVFSMVLTSCRSCKKVQDTVVCGYDFTQCIKDDYQYMVDSLGDGNFKWFVTTGWINGTFDSIGDSVVLNKVESVFQVYDSNSPYCFIITHNAGQYYDTNNVTIDTVHGHWSECVEMSPDTMGINFEVLVHHIERDQKAQMATPHADVVVYRRPLMKNTPTYPYYIVGNSDGYVVVYSAETGERIDSFNTDSDGTRINDTVK